MAEMVGMRRFRLSRMTYIIKLSPNTWCTLAHQLLGDWLSADVHSHNSCYEICLFLFLCQLLHGIIQGVEEDVDVFFLVLAGFLE